MELTFVIDTNVFIGSPDILNHLENVNVVIPIAVVEELDEIKERSDATSASARHAIRSIERLREFGKLSEGVHIEKQNLKVKVDTNCKEQTPLDDSVYDNRILGVAIHHKATLLTNDLSLRIKAESYDVPSRGYPFDEEEDFDEVDELYLPDAVINQLYKQGQVSMCGDLRKMNLYPNQYLVVRDYPDSSRSARVRYDYADDMLVLVKDVHVWGDVTHRNKEQAFALDALTNDDIPIVILSGEAGTGKTFLALATAFERVLGPKRTHKQVLVARPTVPVDRDIGYLKGDKDEKLTSWLEGIIDNASILFGDDPHMFFDYVDKGQIEMEAITYMRGRSLRNKFIIIDECFPGRQRVATENGKESLISLYRKYKRGKELPLVQTFNEETGQFELKKILSITNKGEREIVEVRCANRKIRCTPNHPFLTSNGWKRADSLKRGDLLVSYGPKEHQIAHSLNGDQLQIVIGSYLGDGHISKSNNEKAMKTVRLRVTHGEDQREYCEWKASMFGSKATKIKSNGYSGKPAYTFQSKIFATDNCFIGDTHKKNCPQWVLDELDERGLAIWFMDDGSKSKLNNGATISTHSFDKDSNERMAKKLIDMGIDCKVRTTTKGNFVYYYIGITKDGLEVLSQLIAPYVHSSMSYKILEDYADVERYEWDNRYPEFGYMPVKGVVRLNKTEIVYDVEVEGNHNFVVCSESTATGVNGPVVHNCQNASPEVMKTILTRVGAGSKIVLMGDETQIDNKFLNNKTCGLTYLIEKAKSTDLAAHVHLVDSNTRSEVAAWSAANL